MPLILRLWTGLTVSVWRWGTLLLALTVLAAALWLYAGQGGLWVRMAQPLFQGYDLASLLSYSQIIDGVPLQKENLPTFKGVALLSGGAVSAEFYQTRVLYNYLASLLAPLTGMMAAFQIVNVLCWGGAVALSWRLARTLSGGDERAAAAASVLTMLSLGWLIQLSDYSAHILADLTYLAGAVWLVESGVWRRRRRFTVHLALGLGLALASLAYNTGLMLLVAYGLLAWRHNAARHLLAAMLVGGTAQPLWAWVLDRLALHPAEMIEGGYLARSLARWAELLHDPSGFLGMALRFIAEYQTVDMPLLGSLALLSLAVSGRWRKSAEQADRRWLLLVLVLVPFAAILPFRFSTTGTVAYTVLGVTPVLHGIVAVWLCSLRRRQWIWIGGLIGLQAVWCSSALWGWNGPMLAYFYGPFDIGGAWWHRPEILSLTGQEPTPRLFGGWADLAAAGLAFRPQEMFSSGYNPLLGLLAKALPSLYLALFLWVILPPGPWRRRLAWSGGVALVVLSGMVVNGRGTAPPLTVNIWSTLTVAAGQTVEYGLTVSPAMRDRIRNLPPDASLSLFFGIADGEAELSLLTGAGAVPLPAPRPAPSHGLALDLVERESLSHSGEWTVRMVARSRLTLRGWQRADLVQRRISPALPVLPLLEMRAYAADGGLLWAGF